MLLTQCRGPRLTIIVFSPHADDCREQRGQNSVNKLQDCLQSSFNNHRLLIDGAKTGQAMLVGLC